MSQEKEDNHFNEENFSNTAEEENMFEPRNIAYSSQIFERN